MLKKISFIFAGLIVLLFLTAMIAPYFINSERMKGIILGQIEHNTGYTFNVKGNLNISVFPFTRVVAKNVSVANATDNKNPILTIGTLDIGLRLFPLLRGKIDISSFTLENPVLNLVKNVDSNNWDAPSLSSSQNPQKGGEAKKSRQTSSSINFNKISITNGSITFQDNSSKKNIHLEELNATIKMADDQKNMNLSMDTKWNRRPLTLDATIDSPDRLLGFQATQIDAVVKSDLMKVMVKGTSNILKYEGDFSIDTPSITKTIAWLTGESDTPKISQDAVFIVGNAECTISGCKFSALNAQYDDVKLKGSVSIGTEGSRPYVITDLQAGTLDLSPFMAKKQASLSLIKDAFADSIMWSNSPYPLALLEEIDGSFKIKAGTFIANQFKAKNVMVLAKIERGFLSAEATNVEMYDGTADLFVNVESTGKLDGRTSFKNIALDPLLSSLNTDNRIAGKASGKASFIANASSEASLVSTLNAVGNINIADGSVKGVDIAGMIRNIQSAFKDVDKIQQKTDFSEMSASYTITNGIIKNDDLMMEAPLFRVSGNGTVNLPMYDINYRLTTQIVETIQGQGGKEKTGLGVPILITGSLSDPKYAPDAKGMVQDALRNPEKVKETVQSIKDLVKKPKPAPAPDGAPATTPSTTQEKPMNQLKNLLNGF